MTRTKAIVNSITEKRATEETNYTLDEFIKSLAETSTNQNVTSNAYNYVEKLKRAREFATNNTDPRLRDIYTAYDLSRRITAQIVNAEFTPAPTSNISAMQAGSEQVEVSAKKVQEDVDSVPPPTYPYLYLIGLGTAIAAGVSLGFVIGRKINSSGDSDTVSLQSLGSNTKELFTLFGKYAIHLRINK